MKSLFFRLVNFINRIASYFQGKGYGTASISQEIKLALRLLNKKPTLAIDIGANIGDYSTELLRRNPSILIHMFEPSATNFQKLLLKFANKENIKVLPFAVSDKPGLATLFSNEAGSVLSSLTKRRLDHFNITFDVKESVRTIAFEDYWIKNLNKSQIDIVKIDIEGHELSALKGFGKAIFSTHIIQFEFGGCNIDTRTYFQDFYYFFTEHNFKIFRITPFGIEYINRYKESDEYFSTTNYIAVNQSLI